MAVRKLKNKSEKKNLKKLLSEHNFKKIISCNLVCCDQISNEIRKNPEYKRVFKKMPQSR